MTTAFVLARLFVFKDSQRALHHSAMFFVLVNLVAVAQTWLISMALAYYVLPSLGVTRYSAEIAHGGRRDGARVHQLPGPQAVFFSLSIGVGPQ